MKTKLSILLTSVFFLLSICVSGQVIDPKKEAEKESTKRVNQKIDKGIDKGLDKLEEGIGKLFGKKKKKDKGKQEEPKEQTNDQSSTGNQQQIEKTDQTEQAPSLNWAKYDFVPGDKVIFEDNLIGEENGEFPSRWDLYDGNTENAAFGGENVIMFRDGRPSIVPYLKNSKADYLPEVFTVEFDLYLPNNDFTVYFYDRKNQTELRGSRYLSISTNSMTLQPASSRIPEGKTIKEIWAHIAIAYTNGKLKAYIDETRLINIPHLPFNPSGLTLLGYHANSKDPYLIKNFRIAEGGVKYYDKFLQDGKIITNGIRFDVNKAIIKPESMGVINSIYKILNDNPDLKFSIEGHTDSDGNDALNQTLSEKRAESVMNMLVKMGISANRLSFKGFGESKPIADNFSAEGKANNRRVEFVKM